MEEPSRVTVVLFFVANFDDVTTAEVGIGAEPLRQLTEVPSTDIGIAG